MVEKLKNFHKLLIILAIIGACVVFLYSLNQIGMSILLIIGTLIGIIIQDRDLLLSFLNKVFKSEGSQIQQVTNPTNSPVIQNQGNMGDIYLGEKSKPSQEDSTHLIETFSKAVTALKESASKTNENYREF